MTFLNPLLLWDVGFQLSFAAVMGLLELEEKPSRSGLFLAEREEAYEAVQNFILRHGESPARLAAKAQTMLTDMVTAESMSRGQIATIGLMPDENFSKENS